MERRTGRAVLQSLVASTAVVALYEAPSATYARALSTMHALRARVAEQAREVFPPGSSMATLLERELASPLRFGKKQRNRRRDRTRAQVPQTIPAFESGSGNQDVAVSKFGGHESKQASASPSPLPGRLQAKFEGSSHSRSRSKSPAGLRSPKSPSRSRSSSPTPATSPPPSRASSPSPSPASSPVREASHSYSQGGLTTYAPLAPEQPDRSPNDILQMDDTAPQLQRPSDR